MIDIATKTVVVLRVANIEIYCFMENNQQQILSEIKSLMASVRSQLEELDTKIAHWQQMVEPAEAIDVASLMGDMEFFDKVYELGNEPLVTLQTVVEEPVEEVIEEQSEEQSEEPEEEVAEVPVIEEETAVDLPVEEVVEVAAEEVVEAADEEPVEELLLPAVEEELPVVEEEVQAEEDDDLPFFDVPEEPVVTAAPKVEQAPAPKAEDTPAEKVAVIDIMTQKHRWRTAIPGAPVKDIRGAIALMDRVLFINTLFGTDPMAFQETLNQINQMQTLEQAVEYLASAHPEWDFDSDIVYSFMMAVCRKINA